MSSFEDQKKGRSPVEKFREAFESFVFFHLGSDAAVEFDRLTDGLSISIEHSRVHSFSFHLSDEEVDKLVGDPDQFEAFMLNQLTRHRRHR